jgi:hypothetical protein
MCLRAVLRGIFVTKGEGYRKLPEIAKMRSLVICILHQILLR